MNNPDIINPNEETRITDGCQVSLHFEVSLENGTIIDSTFDRSTPVTLIIGDGNLLTGFENVLINLRAGDVRTAHLPPDEAFGQWNAENVQQFDHAQFATTGSQPEVGLMIEFEDKGKNTLAGVVSKVTSDSVFVDFNHPLAGQNVLFKVQIFKVIPKDNQSVKFT